MNWKKISEKRGEPDFENLLKVLRREVPKRPTLFEFYFNERLYSRVVPGPTPKDSVSWWRRTAKTFYLLGYDYATVLCPGFQFTDPNLLETKETFSLNTCAVIHTQKEFDAFEWPNPEEADYALLDQLSEDLPKGMKLIPYSPDGVLENVIRLMGFDELCLKLYDNPQLVENVFEQVGSRLIQYYKRIVQYDCVGACLANDDWGFSSSTLIAPVTLRRYVFPWYKQIVGISHAAGKPVILHSCGYFENIIEDIIEEMCFDGRHSYEDKIMPVEQAYEKFQNRIAIIGGIDVNFICQNTPEEIYERSKAMLEQAAERGGYALGTGNSVPDYIPDENFLALIRAALD
ncbi:MAG: uroporphyrinogen decarboxylase family protein [Candidatus Aminicenantes bacterium]|jgi:uroporphyrinogen decarboxylase